MATKEASSERIKAFSDGVFAVLITILVLELHAPSEANWSALVELWSTAVSYAASYLFIAIVWINHHHLLRFAEIATQRLVWYNFMHLFSVSLLPFTTSWMARTDLAGVPVCLYAGTLVLVNLTYLALCYEAVGCQNQLADSPRILRAMYIRAAITLSTCGPTPESSVSVPHRAPPRGP
jgi:uncharacterized membrane protein